MNRSTLLLVLAMVTALPAAAQLPIPPDGQIYLGIRANPALASDQEAAIEVREGSGPNGINRPFALDLHYYGWRGLTAQLDSSGTFHPDAQLTGDIRHNRVPVISWVCDGSTLNSDAVIANVSASEDAVILSTAHALAQYPGPVLLRWFWEFNILGNNQNCRGDSGGAPTQQVYDNFIAAWRHIRQLFRSAGATNVVFLWNPGFGGTDPTGFYPGNDVVDWIGVDTYQRSMSATFANDFDSFYQQFSSGTYGNKPLMVGENGAHNLADYGTELQAEYLSGLLQDVQVNRYPMLKAYCYFDSIGPNGNWVLDNSGGLTAFAALGASASFSVKPPPRERHRAARHP